MEGYRLIFEINLESTPKRRLKYIRHSLVGLNKIV
jgi:hypothetical protein